MTATDDYREGIACYKRGRYVLASDRLTAIAGGSDLLGRLGRYWLGRACRDAAMDSAAHGDLEGADQRIRRAAQLVGPHADLARYLGGLYGGRIAMRPAEPVASDSVAAIATEAQDLCRSGRKAEALMLLYQGIRTHGPQSQLHLPAGMILAGQDRIDEARRHFLKAAQYDCSCGQAHRYLGLCDVAEGAFRKAVGRMERALSLNPGDLALIRELLSIVRAAQADGHDIRLTAPADLSVPAVEDIQRLASVVLADSDWVSAFFDLPVSDADEEIFGLLSMVLDMVLAEHSDYADIHDRQSRVCGRLGMTDRAIVHARRAAEINPRYVGGRYHLGALLMAVDPPAAAEHLRGAVDAGGDYADIHATLGVIYERLGKVDDARRELARSLEINCDYAPAREALGRLVA